MLLFLADSGDDWQFLSFLRVGLVVFGCFDSLMSIFFRKASLMIGSFRFHVRMGLNYQVLV